MNEVTGQGRRRILVVEDDAVVADDIAQTLIELGYDVAGVVADADEAVEAAHRWAPDVALMDIRLPGRHDGVDAAHEIGRDREVPVVYVTAHSDPETLERAKDSGPYGYVLKPFTGDRLHAAIEVAMERHRLESLLEEGEARYQATLRSLTEAVVATDASGTLTFVNASAELLLALPASRLVGRPADEALRFTGASGQPIANPLTTALASSAPVYLMGPVHLGTSTGRLIPVRGSVAPIAEPGAAPMGAVAVLHDLSVVGAPDETDDWAAESRRRIEEHTLWASFTLDEGGRVTDCNAAFAAVLGVEIDDALAVDLGALSPDLRAVAREAPVGRSSAPVEVDISRPDGSVAHAIVSLRRMGKGRNAVTGQLVDVTSRERARRRAERSTRMEALGRLADGVSRDLDDLLTVIMGRVDMALGDATTDAGELAEIRRAAVRATELLDRVRAMAAPPLPPRESFGAGDAVREKLEAFQESLGSEVRLSLEVERHVGSVRADRDLFQEAVGALVENAAAALSSEGRISVDVRRRRLSGGGSPGGEVGGVDVVTVTVEDNGEGMDADTLERALEPFFTKRVGGVGLGLTAAYGFAVRHGGTLELDSELGVGTRATLALPRAPQLAVPSAEG